MKSDRKKREISRSPGPSAQTGSGRERLITTTSDMISDRLLGELLAIALSRGGDFADVYYQLSTSTQVSMWDGVIRNISVGRVQGVSVRVVQGEKTGFAYSDDLEPDKLRRAASVAAEIATGGKDYAVPLASSRPAKNYYTVRDDLFRVEEQRKVDLVKRAYKAGKAYDPRIREVFVTYGDSAKLVKIATSAGLIVEDYQPIVRLAVQTVAVTDGKRKTGMQAAGGRVGFEFFDTTSPEELASEAAREAIVLLDAVPAPAGEMPVVVNNGWGGVLLHEAIGHGLEADFIYKKTSLYTGRVGQRVASDLVTVVDDGTIPGRRGTINIDDEGAPSQKKVLIEKGVLKGYMKDGLSARRLGENSTGSGRRQSFRFIPMPRMTNTFMEPGESSPEEIIRVTKSGIYARSFLGGQVNISNGNFVFVVNEGYLIEDGKITAPIDKATLIGNGPEILTRVDMVGNDLQLDRGTGTCGKWGQAVPVGVGQPTLRISAITVGGSQLADESKLQSMS